MKKEDIVFIAAVAVLLFFGSRSLHQAVSAASAARALKNLPKEEILNRFFPK